MNEFERKLSGTTKINVERIEYTWTICNYSSNVKQFGEYLCSPLFSNSENKNVTWCLMLFPKGYQKGHENSVSLFLYLQTKRADDRHQVHVCFSVVDSKQENKINFNARHLYKNIGMWGCHGFAEQSLIEDKANGFLPDDKLTIKCKMIVSIGNCNSTFPEKIEKDLKFNGNFSSLLHDEELTDTIIITRDKEFKVHKAILAAHSPVFMAMFKTDMREKKESRVELFNVDGNVISEVLHYLYTGKVKNFDEYSSDLLKIADQYDISQLKCLIENMLQIKLNENNAIDLLVLADSCNCQKLKQNIIKFIIAHKDVLKKPQNFETLKNTHLAVEVLYEMVNSLFP